jgi:8-oxo-dGTP diphosphatase
MAVIMTRPIPLYESDPAAWQAYLAEGNAKQARKRVAADALIRDTAGRILLVDPDYKPGWDLPGGMAEANEAPADCVARELKEELGLDIRPARLLAVEWVPPHGPWDDQLSFVFDGGTLPPADIAGIRLLDGELNGFEFCRDAPPPPPSHQNGDVLTSDAMRSEYFELLLKGASEGTQFDPEVLDRMERLVNGLDAVDKTADRDWKTAGSNPATPASPASQREG